MGSSQTKQQVEEEKTVVGPPTPPPPPTFNPKDCGHDFLISADDLMDIKSQSVSRTNGTEPTVSKKAALCLFQKQFTEIPDLTYHKYKNKNKVVVWILDELKRQMETFVENDNCPFRFNVVGRCDGYIHGTEVLQNYFESKGYTLSITHNYDRTWWEDRYICNFKVTSKQYTDKYCLDRREIIQEQMGDSLYNYILKKLSKIGEDERWINITVPKDYKQLNDMLKLGLITFDNNYIGSEDDFDIDYKYAMGRVIKKIRQYGCWIGTKRSGFETRIIVFKEDKERKYFKRMKNDDGFKILEPIKSTPG